MKYKTALASPGGVGEAKNFFAFNGERRSKKALALKSMFGEMLSCSCIV